MPRKVLVVANRTAESPELLEAMKAKAAEGETQFLLVVPASGHGLQKAADPDAARAESQTHADVAGERLRAEGLNVLIQMGDSDPLAAVEDAANFGEFDEVIVSTLPQRASRWLKMDLPTRVERTTGLKVTHVESKQSD
jgi:hypothetical protein